VLRDAQERERGGCLPEAIQAYEAAIATAERSGEHAVRVEALRRLAVARYRRAEREPARALCKRSYHAAIEIGHRLLAAEALNALGGMDLTDGSLEDARRCFLEALELGGLSRALCARVEQNLGILANIQGDLDEAIARYEQSLESYRFCEDLHGCALAYHNLGMVSADREQFDDADAYFKESQTLATRAGDVYLQGLCLVNHAEVDVARQRFENARQKAEAALAIFDQLGAGGPKADAYRVIGTVYRETGRPALAESRLRSAIELAAGAGSALSEAEASRELALHYQSQERNREALQQLNAAYRLFRGVSARADLVNVGGKVAELEAAYLAVVRAWGRSIESADPYTYGHCERVARDAVAIARALGLDEHQETTILLGAYLHDVGQMRVPHEILQKRGRLTADELAVVRSHPIWGAELLADVEFPWDIEPIVRWHHERCDGSGYPDGLEGDAIPLAAQVVGILDVYDALTTPRGYKEALPKALAIEKIVESRAWWSDRVVEAFLTVMDAPPER
jgi:putative nucleotidyltransferase with HDIG domain